MSYSYVVETIGRNVYYMVTMFPHRTGRRRMRVKLFTGYREPS